MKFQSCHQPHGNRHCKLLKPVHSKCILYLSKCTPVKADPMFRSVSSFHSYTESLCSTGSAIMVDDQAHRMPRPWRVGLHSHHMKDLSPWSGSLFYPSRKSHSRASHRQIHSHFHMPSTPMDKHSYPRSRAVSLRPRNLPLPFYHKWYIRESHF